MMTFRGQARRSPGLVARVLGFSFAVIACVIVAVFVLLSWQTKDRLTRAVAENLEIGQRRFADREARKKREQLLQAMALAENPTLKAAVDTYHSEKALGQPVDQLQLTIQLELEKLQKLLAVAALSVTDTQGVILASTGTEARDWAAGDRVRMRAAGDTGPAETLVGRGSKVYLATVVPLVIGGDMVGEFYLATPVNDGYARELSEEARTDVAILLDDRVIASSAPPAVRVVLESLELPSSGTLSMDGAEYVVRRLSTVDAASVYAIASLTAAAEAATAEAASVLAVIGVGALLLAAVGSWLLARTLASPIHQLTTALADMARERDFEQPLPRTGTSRELDTLAETFDALRRAVAEAEAESEATYLGVIGALAAALDARDPYTAGHSERVADVSVAIGRAMRLSDADLEVVRLGALLHDIGKIGVPDAVLRKPGTLTPDEFEQIKLHPTLGARILKPLRFLEGHLAIVELHHERPDGRGYPHGLRGNEIPLPARIVHVADAFDAITTARAYRPGRPATEAMAELWRHAGTDFDLEVVHAMTTALPTVLTARAAKAAVVSAPGPADVAAAQTGSLVQFRARSARAAVPYDPAV